MSHQPPHPHPPPLFTGAGMLVGVCELLLERFISPLPGVIVVYVVKDVFGHATSHVIYNVPVHPARIVIPGIVNTFPDNVIVPRFPVLIVNCQGSVTRIDTPVAVVSPEL